MKKTVAYLLSSILFWIGHVIHLPMFYWDWSFLYTPYQCLMEWSVKVQEWGGSDGPWQSTITETYEEDQTQTETDTESESN